jgi:hypothetical protein
MSMRAQRGLVLVVAAVIGLLVLVANSANDGPEQVTQVASAIAVVGGAVGLVLLALGLLRD